MIFGIVAASQLAAPLGLGLLRERVLARTFLALAAAIAFVWSWRSTTSKRLFDKSEMPAMLPGVLLVLTSIVAWQAPLARGAAWYLTSGSDNLTHLVMAARRAHHGFLSYAVDPYPGAWHATMALVITASDGSTPTAELLRRSLRMFPAAVWLLFALLSLSVGLLARLYTARIGLDGRWAAAVVLASGTTMLGGSFFGFTVPYGFQSHVLARNSHGGRSIGMPTW